MKKRTAALLFALSAAAPLAGCVSAEELRAQDEATCSSYGFQPGTPSFATCLQNENLARQAYWSATNSYDLYGPWGPYGYAYYPGPFIGFGGWHYHHWDHHHWGGGWHGHAGGWHGAHLAGAAHGGGFHGGGGGGHR